ncbi:hypothetical protein [Marinicellulosiphila megalodicopiae]|uniref:hypothetical protein n=1 Tax=Marinicellulosiphila megalodicopiae TaxID=2724896 RepID=UPI003BAE6803
MKTKTLCTASFEQCQNENCFDRARMTVLNKLQKRGLELNKINYVDLSDNCEKKPMLASQSSGEMIYLKAPKGSIDLLVNQLNQELKKYDNYPK